MGFGHYLKKRVCVIGAGPSGLLTLRGLDKTLDKEQFEIVCFERYGNLGGQWGHQYKEGLEKDGMESHSGMYDTLISNVPKEIMEIPDFPFSKSERNPKPSYDGSESSYITRVQFLDYLDEFTEVFDLKQYIQYNSWIDRVTFDEVSQQFTVKIEKFRLQPEAVTCEQVFDYVIVASGHFTCPKLVSYPGQETFTGTVIHSKQFADAKKYRGQRVLIVGASYSAEDIAIRSFREGAARVTLCSRSTPPPLKYHPDIQKRPIITKIEQDTISFKDGTSDQFDVIIYCTGYQYNFPFLEDKLQLETDDKYMQPLFQGVSFPACPNLFFIGMQYQVYAFPMFWLQGLVSAKLISGEIHVPSREEMEKEALKDLTVNDGKPAEDLFELIAHQAIYLDKLSEVTGEQTMDGMDMFKQWVEDRTESIMDYKRHSHFNSKFEHNNNNNNKQAPCVETDKNNNNHTATDDNLTTFKQDLNKCEYTQSVEDLVFPNEGTAL